MKRLSHVLSTIPLFFLPAFAAADTILPMGIAAKLICHTNPMPGIVISGAVCCESDGSCPDSRAVRAIKRDPSGQTTIMSVCAEPQYKNDELCVLYGDALGGGGAGHSSRSGAGTSVSGSGRSGSGGGSGSGVVGSD